MDKIADALADLNAALLEAGCGPVTAIELLDSGGLDNLRAMAERISIYSDPTVTGWGLGVMGVKVRGPSQQHG